MDPNILAKCGTEHGHQTALFCWAANNRQRFPELEWYFAVPNGGERNKIVASRLKAEGVKSGVSDTMLPVARRGYHGFFIEMKKPPDENGKGGGIESVKQTEFGRFVAENGYLYVCCDHWTKAAQYLAWYLGVEDGTY